MIPWTVACQAPPSTGFSRQEHWRGLPCPPPGDLPNPGIEPRSPALQVDSLPSEPPGKPSSSENPKFRLPATSCEHLLHLLPTLLCQETHTRSGGRGQRCHCLLSRHTHTKAGSGVCADTNVTGNQEMSKMWASNQKRVRVLSRFSHA